MGFHAIPSTRRIKSFKKDDQKRKKFFPRGIRSSFKDDFSFLIIFFQGFNPPLDEWGPLIQMQKIRPIFPCFFSSYSRKIWDTV